MTNPLVGDAGSSDAVTLEAAYNAVLPFLHPISGLQRVALQDASDRVAARDIRSQLPLPLFDNAAVDGYGLTNDDLVVGRRLRIVGRIMAGSTPGGEHLASGTAVYLSTGAVVPVGVQAVVMHERTSQSGEWVTLNAVPAPGANIRRVGEDVAKGSTIVPANTLLDYRHIAVLAASGLSTVMVRGKVRVSLISTGDELRPQGTRLAPGQIFNVNAPMLSSLLDRQLVDVVGTPGCKDDREVLSRLVRGCAEVSDIIVSTGGAAGSDSDHAHQAIVAAGGAAISLRMALRPGKPIVVGKIGNCLVLSLPGNPFAALTNFMLFVRPAISVTLRPALAPATRGSCFSLGSHPSHGRANRVRTGPDRRLRGGWATTPHQAGTGRIGTAQATRGCRRHYRARRRQAADRDRRRVAVSPLQRVLWTLTCETVW